MVKQKWPYESQAAEYWSDGAYKRQIFFIIYVSLVLGKLLERAYDIGAEKYR